MASPYSRRDFLTRFLPVKPAAPAPVAQPMVPSEPEPARPQPHTDALLAVIAGRHCLAYQGTACSACHEQCPVPGAIVVTDGLPRVDLTKCTGCQLCHEVCPAPTNAVFITARPPGIPMPGLSLPEANPP
jgi:Fe-S-cluster-containing hydrogenase component 2